MGQSIRAIIIKNEKLLGKKTASICIIIIGMIVVLPFNYMYGIGGFEVDAVWAIVGIVMIATGFYLLKNSAKLKPI
jgi:hypothetical protein